MEYLERIATEFVRDRLKETEWENRRYIADLCLLESIMKRRGPSSAVEAMFFKGLQSVYPVEYECIKKELTSGERTSQEEFVRLRQEWTQKKMDEERERSERWAEQDKKNWEKWVRAGGR
ncbi:MAG TPA: hypothetical protein GX008_04420 [Firmicutes bacterium]|jgi:hypothetical protein|nr:hypothetical protein [Bacillota bacterium]